MSGRTLRCSSAPPLATDLPPDPPSATYPVRLTFPLPDRVLVSPGPHGFNTAVLPGNVGRIRGREILNWQSDHFVYIVIRGRALDGGVGAAGEIDSVSQAL